MGLLSFSTPRGAPVPYGTLQVSDSLNALLASQVSVLQFGLVEAYDLIAEDLAAWNAIVQEELSLLAEMGEDVMRVYGGAQAMTMLEGDEFSDPDAEKVAGGIAVAFPLRRGEIKVAFTRDWLATNDTQQLAAQYDAAKLGDLQRIQRKLQEAIFFPISRPTVLPNGTPNPNPYRDRLVPPNVPLPLFPLLNADGAPVPVGPNGETFDPLTHTHYAASDWTSNASTPATRDGDLQAVCNNLVEHNVTGRLCLFINFAQEAQIRALPSFVPMFDANVQVANNITFTQGALNPRNFNNRMIGTYRGFEVWIKPWVFPNYVVPFSSGDTKGRPIYWRTRKGGLCKDFGLFYEDDDIKLKADTMIRDGGCSVWMRHMAVVLYTGGPTYVSPVPNGS